MIEAWRNSDLFGKIMFTLFAVILFVIVAGVFNWSLNEPHPAVPYLSVCDREQPTAGMILDCQATREAATAIASDK